METTGRGRQSNCRRRRRLATSGAREEARELEEAARARGLWISVGLSFSSSSLPHGRRPPPASPRPSNVAGSVLSFSVFLCTPNALCFLFFTKGGATQEGCPFFPFFSLRPPSSSLLLLLLFPAAPFFPERLLRRPPFPRVPHRGGLRRGLQKELHQLLVSLSFFCRVSE